jgi:hypothetical protein
LDLRLTWVVGLFELGVAGGEDCEAYRQRDQADQKEQATAKPIDGEEVHHSSEVHAKLENTRHEQRLARAEPQPSI